MYDERVWAISKINPVKPSKKFEGHMRFITLKNIDTNKTAKVWLDSRFRGSWHNFDNFHEGDLIYNLHDLKGYNALNADSVKLKKCPHKEQTTIIPDHDHDHPVAIELNGKEESKISCAQCTILSKALNNHLLKVHQVSLF